MISSLELNFYSKSSKLVKSFKLSFQDSKKDIEFESYNFTLPDNLFIIYLVLIKKKQFYL